MQVLIIEDEAPAFRRLQQLLGEINPHIEIVEVIDSVRDSVAWLKTHDAPDLIFMDIQLADGLSFHIFDQIQVRRPVIFTTAYDEYTLQAFKVNSIDYLLKPLNKDELTASLQKLESMKRELSEADSLNVTELLASLKQPSSDHYRTRFLVKRGQRLVSIEHMEIASFYTQDGLVFLKTANGNKFPVDFTLDDLVNELDPKAFFRLNRQVIASYKSIRDIHNYFKGKLKITLEPSGLEEVIVSREKAQPLKRWLGV